MILTNWVSKEPFGSLLLAVVVVLLFGITVHQLQSQKNWLQAIAEALSKSLSFAALAAMVYFLLVSNTTAFENTHGSFTRLGSRSYNAYQEWEKIYGDSFFQQQDLQVTQYKWIESVEPLPENPVLYKTIRSEQILVENSISRFFGTVYLQGADWGNRDATFNAYSMKAAYEYDVINTLTEQTETRFYFPLFGGAKLYEKISVKMSDEPVNWVYKNGGLVWESTLQQGEQKTILIEYKTWSMDGYSFVVQEARDVKDFTLIIGIDYSYCCLHYEPVERIQLDTYKEGQYNINKFSLNRAVTAPSMGLSVIQKWPYAPYHQMMAAMPFAARASLFFLTVVVLTWIIYGVQIDLQKIALLGSLFLLPFIIMMSGYFPHPDFIYTGNIAEYQVKMMPILSLLSILMAFYLLRRNIDKEPLWLTLILMEISMGGYVLISFIIDEQKRNATEALIQVGVIGYIFLLTLFTRLRAIGLSDSKPPSRGRIWLKGFLRKGEK